MKPVPYLIAFLPLAAACTSAAPTPEPPTPEPTAAEDLRFLSAIARQPEVTQLPLGESRAFRLGANEYFAVSPRTPWAQELVSLIIVDDEPWVGAVAHEQDERDHRAVVAHRSPDGWGLEVLAEHDRSFYTCSVIMLSDSEFILSRDRAPSYRMSRNATDPARWDAAPFGGDDNFQPIVFDNSDNAEIWLGRQSSSLLGRMDESRELTTLAPGVHPNNSDWRCGNARGFVERDPFGTTAVLRRFDGNTDELWGSEDGASVSFEGCVMDGDDMFYNLAGGVFRWRGGQSVPVAEATEPTPCSEADVTRCRGVYTSHRILGVLHGETVLPVLETTVTQAEWMRRCSRHETLPPNVEERPPSCLERNGEIYSFANADAMTYFLTVSNQRIPLTESFGKELVVTQTDSLRRLHLVSEAQTADGSARVRYVRLDPR